MRIVSLEEFVAEDEPLDVDLFAGPGGWDEGAAELGIRPLGIEWDDAACATRRARGHETLQADVAALDPQEFAPVRVLIGSPPCQAFSMAGLGAGRKALQAYIDAIGQLFDTGVVDRESLDEKCEDPRGHLVLEPLRWAMQLRPRFVALEQVEPVLPLWEAIAAALRQLGYGVWTGVLSAERYGVPQTRKRAILLAKLDGQVSEPPATHQRYVPPRVKAKQEESLFDAPEPERIVAAEDRELLPWVSMAEALGWGDVRSVVGFPRRADGGSAVEIDGQEYRRRDFRRASEPAFALTEKARSAVRLRANAQANAAERSVDEPAPTITGGHDTADRVWVTGQERTAGPSRDLEPRSIDDPSYTIRTATGSGDPGVGRTPIFPPGHFHRSDDGPAEGNAGPNGAAVRVSVAEASVLQSFPPDYPWQGTRTAQYRQIGDAVPPLLARAILAHLMR